jgi:hypothetical protein
MEAVSRMASGRAWYVGKQSTSNVRIDEPPFPYLCELPDGVASRARNAGHFALLQWQGRDVFVAYFVDPRHGHLYAQEIPRTGVAVDAPEPGGPWGFATARAFARWLGLASEDEWAKYVARRLPQLPPVPPELPASPETAYQAEWQSWADWLKESRATGNGTASVAEAR